MSSPSTHAHLYSGPALKATLRLPSRLVRPEPFPAPALHDCPFRPKRPPEKRTNQKMPAAALSGHLFLSQETSSLILLLPKLQGEQELPEFYLTLTEVNAPVGSHRVEGGIFQASWLCEL